MTVNFERRTAAVRNAFEIFEGQWCSNVPLYGGGPADLFHDQRMLQFDKLIGGFAGKKVLELGPLEAGHTYCMSILGATDILAIEANKDAFLRCLVIKELLDLKARFICGDFESYMMESPPRVDVILASGILYHMKDPLRTIEAMCKVSDQICVWTHYYSSEVITRNSRLNAKFDAATYVDFSGLKVECARQSYNADLQRTDFAGGVDEFSTWISLSGFEAVFEKFGFQMSIIERQEEHPHGPSVTFVAKRFN